MPPEFGPHDGELSIADFLRITLGALYSDNDEELAKIDPLVKAYGKLHVHDCSDFEGAVDSMHMQAIGTVVEAAEVKGLKGLLFKYFGTRNLKWVPPVEAPEGVEAACLSPVCALN